MALTNRQLQAFERANRNRYIIAKNDSITRIVGTYISAYDDVAEFLASNSSAKLSNRNLNKYLVELDERMYDQQEFVERNFTREMKIIGNLAVDDVTAPLFASGYEFSDQSMRAVVNIYVNRDLAIPKHKDGKNLSQRIWGKDKRSGVITQVYKGINEGKTTFEIADDIKQYARKGSGFNSAFRLAYNELTSIYAENKLQSAREWNGNPIADFQLGIEQYLSATHVIFDECDILAGLYRIDDLIPIIPRHIGCNCGQRQIILRGADLARLSDVGQKLETVTKDDRLPNLSGSDVTLY